MSPTTVFPFFFHNLSVCLFHVFNAVGTRLRDWSVAARAYRSDRLQAAALDCADSHRAPAQVYPCTRCPTATPSPQRANPTTIYQATSQLQRGSPETLPDIP
eukprot:1086071-Rhodomonas_salina.2